MHSLIHHQIEAIYHRDARKVFATLVRVLGDMDLAEDALQESFKAATQQWPSAGLPHNPFTWLVSAGRFKAIDQIRRENRFAAALEQGLLDFDEAYDPLDESELIEDDRLRLMFTCCHPALAFPVQVALTLREVCGLTTEAIASAFLVTPATMAQRIVRGKHKIRAAGIPYEVPNTEGLTDRLDSVLTVIYLIFNEGYHASSGNALTRPDLSQEAIRLTRLLLSLLPHTDVQSLLALMLLHESRRPSRLCADGDLVLLDQQDRSLWDQTLIAEAKSLLQQALKADPVSSFAIEAAIAAVHADAHNYIATDWSQIVELYRLLLQATQSPVIELNYAVAVSMSQGPTAGLVLVEKILSGGLLNQYHLLHAAKADMHRRLAQKDLAVQAYQTALTLSEQEPEKRFLQRRLQEFEESE